MKYTWNDLKEEFNKNIIPIREDGFKFVGYKLKDSFNPNERFQTGNTESKTWLAFALDNKDTFAASLIVEHKDFDPSIYVYEDRGNYIQKVANALQYAALHQYKYNSTIVTKIYQKADPKSRDLDMVYFSKDASK